MEYTKGPWEVVHEYNIQQSGTRRGICSCGTYSSNTVEAGKIYKENINNAYLVAAAPDLYEACKKLIIHKHQGDIHPIDYQRIEQALARAEGVDLQKPIFPEVDFTR